MAEAATLESGFVVSEQTREKVEIVKKYIAEKYQKNLELEKKKKEYWDKLFEKMNENEISKQEQDRIRSDLLHQDAKLNREQ